jgi:pseudouridine-5'-phosphate glycosidase
LHLDARGDAVSGLVRVAPEVAKALAGGVPVVALETAFVSHGFPEGEGVAVATEAERRVRAAGAVPAVVGVIDGAVAVGLDRTELQRFASSEARKVGPRDLAACAVQDALGATTVGGTLAACRIAGIRHFATGGLGGVHRGYAQLPDVSADLAELARTRALVVCSGVKSLLDVPATAELLESLGVPVLGWQTTELPLFYAPAGGPPVSARVETAEEAARVARAHWELGRESAVVLARPQADGLDVTLVERLVDAALTDAAAAGIRGQAVTPFVLARLHEASGGRTLAVNRELIAANAGLAAEVAVADRELG